jgi:hypothetical protein
MQFVQRLKRRWQLSGPQQPLPTTALDAGQLHRELQALHQKAEKIMEWMGILLRAEINGHEQ